jgi:phospholipid-binding lipoprotein MlaA
MRHPVEQLSGKMTSGFRFGIVTSLGVKSLGGAFLGFAMLFMGGCTAVPESQRSDVRDVYEPTNRKIFAFNMGLDTYVLEPAAKGYRDYVHESGKEIISNHVTWAGMPSTAINSTLQGKFENAGLATINFLVNGLTLGFGDLVEDETPIQKENFGQTLAAANMPEGSYLMVPVLGPRTARSFAGNLVDMVLNPMGILAAGSGTQTINTVRPPLAAVAFRARNFDTFNDVKYNSIDPYSRIRSVYYQSQYGASDDDMTLGVGESDSDDEFDAFFESEQ